MKLLNPSFEILEQKSGVSGILKQIELAGRTCYKSLDKITDTSCNGFVDRMIKSNHTAMLEHGTVYLLVKESYSDRSLSRKYAENKYSKVVTLTANDEYVSYITTNYRVLVENNWLKDLIHLSEPTTFHEKRHTVRFVANIQFYKDVTRHRVFSWAIESTRYCNYIKNKFGGSVTYIKPIWYDSSTWYQKLGYKVSLRVSDLMYRFLVKTGWQAQQASNILPQATKAEVIMTGFDSDWKHFFNLRAKGTTGAPHPQVKELAYPLMEEFVRRGYISEK